MFCFCIDHGLRDECRGDLPESCGDFVGVFVRPAPQARALDSSLPVLSVPNISGNSYPSNELLDTANNVYDWIDDTCPEQSVNQDNIDSYKRYTKQ